MTVSLCALNALLVVTLLGACDDSVVGVCPDVLVTRLDPRSTVLGVGGSVVVTARAEACGKALPDQWHYFLADTAVASVDSLTGRVTARRVGATEVGARGTRYGDVGVRTLVTVTP